MKQVVWTFLLATLLACTANAVFAKDIAICGTSVGYGFYPKVGLIATNQKAGKWQSDEVNPGKLTLVMQMSKKELDLLATDRTGRVFSAKQDGGNVLLLGDKNNVISIIVLYPTATVVETYTFFRNASGKAEVMWTSNKGGAQPIMKAAAYKADCSFFIY